MMLEWISGGNPSIGDLVCMMRIQNQNEILGCDKCTLSKLCAFLVLALYFVEARGLGNQAWDESCLCFIYVLSLLVPHIRQQAAENGGFEITRGFLDLRETFVRQKHNER